MTITFLQIVLISCALCSAKSCLHVPMSGISATQKSMRFRFWIIIINFNGSITCFKHKLKLYFFQNSEIIYITAYASAAWCYIIIFFDIYTGWILTFLYFSLYKTRRYHIYIYNSIDFNCSVACFNKILSFIYFYMALLIICITAHFGAAWCFMHKPNVPVLVRISHFLSV